MQKVKNQTSRFKIMAFVFLILMVPFVQNANSMERQVSLSEAVKIALENNHELKAFNNSLSAYREDIGIARSYLLPRVTFEETYMRTNNPTYVFSSKLNEGRFAMDDFAINSLNNPKAVNDFQTLVSFQQPIFVRKADIGLNMAKTEYSAKNEDYIRKKEEIALKVTQAYLMLHTAKEYTHAAEKAVEDAKEHMRIAELRYNAGLGLYSDTLRASTAATDAEQKLISAQKNLNVAKRALGLLLGMAEPVDTAGDVPEVAIMPIDYYTDASSSRKDLKALEIRYENAKNNVKLAEAGYFPMIGIGGSYQLNDHNKPFSAEGQSWQVAAFLKWELFDGAKRGHEKAKARHQVNEAEEYLHMLKKAVSFKVYEAFLSVEEARKNKELSMIALKTAAEGKRLVNVRYENSLSPIVDLLNAQVSLDYARASLVAKNNEYLTAIAILSYESGTILKDLKIEE